MKFKDLVNIILSLTEKIEKIWVVFYASNATIIIWIMSSNNFLYKKIELIVAISIYLLYTYFNMMLLIRAYKFLDLAISEAKNKLKPNSKKTNQISILFSKFNFKSRIIIVFFTFLATTIIILILLFSKVN